MFGVMVGDTVRIKVLREDLDTSARLFAVAGDSPEPQIEVVEPAAGSPISASGIVKVKGLADTSSGQTLEIRLGSAEGPVIAEAEPHVFSRLTLNLTPHIVSIHQAAAGSGSGLTPISEGELRQVISIARAVWRPAGIHLNFGTTRLHDLNNAPWDDYAFNRTPASNAASFGHVFGLGRAPLTINVYFVSFIEGSLGYGLRSDTTSGNFANLTGILLATLGRMTVVNASPPITAASFAESPREEMGDDFIHVLGGDLAHEVGHLLNLSHVHNDHGLGREDTYARSQLMHPQPYLPHTSTNANIRRNDAGAGLVEHGGQRVGMRGSLLTLKNLGSDPVDGEITTARKRMGHADLYT
jgi:hypothetical protein